MQTKRICTLLITLALALSLFACASSDSAADPADSADPSVKQEESPPPQSEETPAGVQAEAPAYHTPPPQKDALKFPAFGYVAKEGVNLRAEPKISGDILEVLGENVELKLISLQDEWYRVEYEGQTAYMHEDLVAIGHAPRKHNMHWVKVTAKEAALYKTPGGDKTERKLAQGEIVRALRTINGYKHVALIDHTQRYIHVDDITVAPAEEANAAQTKSAPDA